MCCLKSTLGEFEYSPPSITFMRDVLLGLPDDNGCFGEGVWKVGKVGADAAKLRFFSAGFLISKLVLFFNFLPFAFFLSFDFFLLTASFAGVVVAFAAIGSDDGVWGVLDFLRDFAFRFFSFFGVSIVFLYSFSSFQNQACRSF